MGMNPPKCDELDYIHFLLAAQTVFTNTEAARCHPGAGTDGPAHDAYTRLLYRAQADGDALWKEVRPCVRLTEGILVIDDTTLDKLYARAIRLVTRQAQGIRPEVMLLAWFDRNTGEFSPPIPSCLEDRPGWLAYALSRGADLIISLNGEEYVFAFKKL